MFFKTLINLQNGLQFVQLILWPFQYSSEINTYENEGWTDRWANGCADVWTDV